MTLNMILDSIGAWNTLRTQQNATQINALFSVGNYFNYTKETLLDDEIGIKKASFMHVYMGVKEGKLKMFLIDSRRDTQSQYESAEGILPYITICSLHEGTGNLGGEISRKDALLRIDAWEDGHEEWVENQVQTVDNIFQAFAIPGDDLTINTPLKIYFGLKPNPNLGDPLADLIIVEPAGSESKQVVYYDMVRPVPPFGASGSFAVSSFYLLELC